MGKINILKDIISERITKLEDDLRDEPNHSSNHLASMISGEIEGLRWVLDQINEEQSDFNEMVG